jgi:hypothetical protein
MDALVGRMNRMESELARWKTLGVAALVVLGLVVFFWAPWGGPATAEGQETKEYTIAVPPEVFKMGQPQEVEELRARRVLLVDSRGEPRASLQVSSTGSPSLELFGSSGRTQASLSVKGSGTPGLVFYDRMGRVLWRAP